MTTTKTTTAGRVFPLQKGHNGQWLKKICGKAYYFGSWRRDPKGTEAIKDYLARRDAIVAGMDGLRVEDDASELTVTEMCQRFMESRRERLLEGSLADETLNDYRYELRLFAGLLGNKAIASQVKPKHFAKYAKHLRSARRLGPHRMATVIRYIRALFNHAATNGWISAVNFGTEFVAPNTDPESLAVRLARKGDDQDDPLFTSAQIEWLLANATKQFRAMILVMLNCGMGPSDVARLKWKNIDMKTGRLSLRRRKNGIRRECYLWKKTRAALEEIKKLKHTRQAIASYGEDGLVFITRKGLAYVRRERVFEKEKLKTTKVSNAISITIGRLVKEAKAAGVIPAKQKLTAYHFRHTYRTHADNCPDLNAVLRSMGRKLYGAADSRYVRGKFKLARLRKVAKTVYRYVFTKSRRQKDSESASAVAPT